MQNFQYKILLITSVSLIITIFFTSSTSEVFSQPNRDHIFPHWPTFCDIHPDLCDPPYQPICFYTATGERICLPSTVPQPICYYSTTGQLICPPSPLPFPSPLPPQPLPPQPLPFPPVCPQWDPQCESTDPIPISPFSFSTPSQPLGPAIIPPSSPLLGPGFNCGINPYAPPCNLPCLTSSNPYCIDDIKDFYMSNANVTIIITNNQSQIIKVLEGNPKEIIRELLNQTQVPRLTNTDKTGILIHIDKMIQDVAMISSPLPYYTNFEIAFETRYGDTAVKVEIKIPPIIRTFSPFL